MITLAYSFRAQLCEGRVKLLIHLLTPSSEPGQLIKIYKFANTYIMLKNSWQKQHQPNECKLATKSVASIVCGERRARFKGCHRLIIKKQQTHAYGPAHHNA